MFTKHSITWSLLQVTRDICSLKKTPLHNADTFSFFLHSSSNACTCQPSSTKERSVVHLHKIECICINQAAALCITLIWNAHCVFGDDRRREAAPASYESLGLSPVLEWVEINPWDHLNAHRCQWDHSRQSVLLLLSSSERERLFSPHFLSVVLSWSHGIQPIGIRGPCKLKIQIKISKIRLCKGYQQIDGPKIFIQ